jgi:DNA topoisomerase-2
MKEIYEKLTPIEHILKRPGMYIGNIQTNLKKLFVVEDIESNDIKIKEKIINYNAGFIKLFDEIVTNAADHSIRTNKVKYIKININSKYITIENDGPGIPVEKHKEHKMYIPEMVFGHLHSGSNFEDNNERTWGGMNGLGAKLTNIYSKKFIVETGDGKNKYTQEFTNNLNNIGKPKIIKSKKNYTKITYFPDFEKFGIKEITTEIEQILMKRVIDISVYCPNVKIYYNDKLIPMKSFKDYMGMYLDEENEIFYERITDDWEIGVTQAKEDSFQQVSMINGISTIIGGTHVNYITNQIVKGVTEILEKKYKKLRIKPNDVKNKLFIFLNSKIVNPTFETQTKENLTTRLTLKHVENVNVSDKLIKQLSKSEMIEDIIDYIKLRENAELKKLNKGKTSKVKIKKLNDANMAGTAQSEKCTLFLTEGDSALGTCITGFASTGRDYFGAFPLKGKPLNVRDTAISKIKNNDEIKHIISALGLEFGKKYTSLKDLRYGKVVCFSDADLDGSHIKGLLINIFETFWSDLLKLDFIYEFVTPILKVTKGKTKKFFYRSL